MTADDPVLRAGSLEVTLDRGTGGIRRLVAGPWSILDTGDPVLGWSLRVPLPNRRDNVADAADQPAPVWTVGPDGSVSALWPTVTTRPGGPQDITVRIDVRAVDERLVFAIEVDNRSPYEVEEVLYPRLGSVRPPDPDRPLHAFAYRYAAGRRHPLLPRFDNVPGYYGVDRPTYLNEGEGTVGAPVCPFVLIEDGERGLSLSVDEPSAELVGWHAQLHPGYGDSLLHTAPTTLDGWPEPTSLRVTAAHLPYVAPGERRRLTPVALAAYTGDWPHGVDLYRARRDTWMAPAAPPAWAREPHSWLQLHLNSPEDELRLPFDRLPEVAASCAEHGVSVIQLVGWNDGGQDRNNPSHDPDPRLGGPAALRDAVARCRALGVRVVLFTKFTWADRSTERFRTDLVREAVTDPYGDYYLHHGYRYQTTAQLFDVNTRRLVPMCFASRRYREVAAAEFETVLSLGADGMLFDESLHHTPALLCFDEAHGHRRGHPVYAEDRAFIRALRAHAAGRDADFLYAGEACYDWEFEEYELSYHRSEDPAHIPLSRYLRPSAQLMTAVTGFDDRNMVNQALLYRYLLSYEPYHFKGRLEDMPLTVAYGQAMDALRTELRAWLWDGEFRATVGATVRAASGAAHHPYAVFTAADGSTAAVVANYAADRAVDVHVDLGPDPVYRLVDEPAWRTAADGVHLPPRSAAVVLPARHRPA